MSVRIKRKFLLLFLLFYLLTILVILTTILYSIYNQVSHSIEYSYHEELKSIDHLITNFFKEIKSDLYTLKSNSIVTNRNDKYFTSFLNVKEDTTYKYNITKEEQKIINIFNDFRLSHSYVNSIYMGRENGTFVRSHKRAKPTRYDPRNRLWYKLGKTNKNNISITEPYAALTTNDINIGNVAALIDKNNKVYGVIGIDVTLTNLSDFMKTLKLPYGGQLEVISDKGTILFNKEKKLLNKNVNTDFFKRIREPNKNSYFLTEKDIIIHYKSNYLKWYIVATVPMKVILYDFLKVSIIFTLITIILLTLLFIVFYKFFIFIIEKLENSNIKLQQDLNTAKNIQKSLLPNKTKTLYTLRFYSEYIPSDELSGDYYDYFKIDNENLICYISDVSGHGVPAAMLTIFLNCTIKSAIEKTKDNLTPSKILNFLYEEYNNSSFDDEVYILLFLFIYNVKNETITYSPAGLNTEPIFIANTGHCKKITNIGFPICKLMNIYKPVYKDYTMKINSHDKLFLYTDGLSDLKGKNEKAYTGERLFEIISRNSKNDGKNLFKIIANDIINFRGDNLSLKDDLTYFVIELK